MKDDHSPALADTMLKLGRLDGRLYSSPAADIYIARARLEGAATLCGLAGVPVDVRHLQNWIAGRTPPPRASEGLNDPISVAAVFHVAIAVEEDSRDPLLRATLNTLRSVLDDRAEAESYGHEDLLHFGSLWRSVRAAADAPFGAATLANVAERIFELSALTQPAASLGAEIISIDGRSVDLPPRSRDRIWLLAAMMPRLLLNAGLTTRIIPSLTLLPKFLPDTAMDLVDTMVPALRQYAEAGLRELDRVERAVNSITSDIHVTKRSKAPLLARLEIAYPDLTPRAVARLLNVTPQGARKLLASRAAERAAQASRRQL